MKRSSLCFAVALGLASIDPASAAMEISRSGRGQVLLFPYYTVNAGNSTLMSLVNHTDDVKAVKIRFREAMNGRNVLDFNIYLPPRGNWRGALAASDSTGPARLMASNDVCSTPLIPEQGVAFRNAFYVESREDDGPDHLARTREGFVEVIEMGVVVDNGDASGTALPLPDAPGNLSGVDNQPGDGNSRLASDARWIGDDVPANCSALVTAWESGVWFTNPAKDIDEPSGGLSGMATIVDVASGVAYNAPATVIDGFFTVPDSAKLHTPPGALEPTLASAQTRAAGPVETVSRDGVALWKPGKADAVSSLLMSENIANRFETDASMDAASEWVVTFPTKQLHIEGDAASRLPFTDATDDSPEITTPGNVNDTSVFDPDGSCEPVELQEFTVPGHARIANAPEELCYQVNVVAFDQAASVEAGETDVFGARLIAKNVVRGDGPGFGLSSGNAGLKLGDADNVLLSEPDGGMRARRFGLPVIGFWAARFVNANAQPGVLANYAVTAAHTFGTREDRAAE